MGAASRFESSVGLRRRLGIRPVVPKVRCPLGLLTELLDDLDVLGTDTAPLRSSADDVVRMWERANAPRSGPVPADIQADLGGIIAGPSHYQRTSEYPEQCGDPYCPGGLHDGERCRFDAECEHGECAGAGDCGNPQGTCE